MAVRPRTPDTRHVKRSMRALYAGDKPPKPRIDLRSFLSDDDVAKFERTLKHRTSIFPGRRRQAYDACAKLIAYREQSLGLTSSATEPNFVAVHVNPFSVACAGCGSLRRKEDLYYNKKCVVCDAQRA